ncbi:hypothetical protein KUL156_60690 [Alteromonas sp. KUL156]|nr:hypothetical protein BACT7_25070 [Tenacibaculum mesophilum]GFD92973.1 hypothetical protein KUL154_17060 [Alteromonas sp. KUL154]GFE03477.1 hypothetical protein KUL156_60690 [Alteromonas sp. KUL156]
MKNCINEITKFRKRPKGSAFVSKTISSNQKLDHKNKVIPNQILAFLFTLNGFESMIKESSINEEKTSI